VLLFVANVEPQNAPILWKRDDFTKQDLPLFPGIPVRTGVTGSWTAVLANQHPKRACFGDEESLCPHTLGQGVLHVDSGRVGVVMGYQDVCDASHEWCKTQQIGCKGCQPDVCVGPKQVQAYIPLTTLMVQPCYYVLLDAERGLQNDDAVVIPEWHTRAVELKEPIQHPHVGTVFSKVIGGVLWLSSMTSDMFSHVLQGGVIYLVPNTGCPDGYQCLEQLHDPPGPYDGYGQCCRTGSANECINDPDTFGEAGTCKAKDN